MQRPLKLWRASERKFLQRYINSHLFAFYFFRVCMTCFQAQANVRLSSARRAGLAHCTLLAHESYSMLSHAGACLRMCYVDEE